MCASRADKDMFSNALDDLLVELGRTSPDAPVLVGLDANGRVGSQPSDAVGTVAPRKEDDNGMRMRSWMEAHTLAAYNTMVGDGAGIGLAIRARSTVLIM